MDDRGRLAQPVTGTAPTRSPVNGAHLCARRRVVRDTPRPRPQSWLCRMLGRVGAQILRLHVPRGVGIAATALVMLSSVGYGAVQGDHVSGLVASFKEARDGAANAAGFRIVSLALSGNRHVS